MTRNLRKNFFFLHDCRVYNRTHTLMISGFLTVLGPPNWRTHLMEDKLTRPIFGWMPSEGFVAFSAFFLTILIVVTIVASTIWYIR